MKSISILALLIGFMLPTLVCSQDKSEPSMKTYTFVMLKKGPNRTQDSLTVKDIQKRHLEHLDHMAKSFELNIAGPFLDDGNWRGLLIFNTDDVEKVKTLVEADPAVSSGRLSYEIHPWMSQQGASLK